MSVVIDANVLVVLALDRDRAPAVERILQRWQRDGEQLHAPSLLSYEVANALTRAVASGQLGAPDVTVAWELIAEIRVMLHTLDDIPAVVELAQHLERRTAYDAAYLLLAEHLGVDLWTLDGPLARNAQGRGLAVKLIDVT